jgi:hypothetical protein
LTCLPSRPGRNVLKEWVQVRQGCRLRREEEENGLYSMIL